VQQLCSVVTYTTHEGHTQYTIRTTEGNSWEAVTRYSAVLVLLKELKQKRDIMDRLRASCNAVGGSYR